MSPSFIRVDQEPRADRMKGAAFICWKLDWCVAEWLQACQIFLGCNSIGTNVPVLTSLDSIASYSKFMPCFHPIYSHVEFMYC